MSPLETGALVSEDVKTMAFMVRPDQIVRIDEVKARLQRSMPDKSISRSQVIREALDRALPQIEADIEAAS